MNISGQFAPFICLGGRLHSKSRIFTDHFRTGHFPTGVGGCHPAALPSGRTHRSSQKAHSSFKQHHLPRLHDKIKGCMQTNCFYSRKKLFWWKSWTADNANWKYYLAWAQTALCNETFASLLPQMPPGSLTLPPLEEMLPGASGEGIFFKKSLWCPASQLSILSCPAPSPALCTHIRKC